MILNICKKEMSFKATLLISIFSFNASAGTIYVDQQVQSNIASEISGDTQHPFNIAASSTCSGGWVGAICKSMMLGGVNAPEIRNINLVDYGTSYSEIKLAPIPEVVEFEYYSVKNCTSSEKSINEDITIVYNESDKIITLDKVTTKSGASIDATISVGDIFSIGGSGSYDKTIDVTKETTITKSTLKTVNESLNEIVKPYTALIYTIEKRSTNAYIDFEGELLVDGELYTANFGNKYVGMISSFFDEEPIKVKGQIWNVSYKSVSKSFLEIPLPGDYRECRNFDINSFSGPSPSTKIKSIILK